jgi:hypothetical protein
MRTLAGVATAGGTAAGVELASIPGSVCDGAVIVVGCKFRAIGHALQDGVRVVAEPALQFGVHWRGLLQTPSRELVAKETRPIEPIAPEPAVEIIDEFLVDAVAAVKPQAFIRAYMTIAIVEDGLQEMLIWYGAGVP